MAYSFKGAISFGLVFIPITLSVSIKNNDIGFNMIDKKSMSRIKYKKTCAVCDGREVDSKDIVKAYQYQKGKYVIFEDEDFEKIKSQKDKSIVIEQFVSLGEVDPIYFDKTYFVSPDGADKAFCVLLEALKKSKKAGIARTVLGTKQCLVLVRAQGDEMILNTMFFEEEVQSPPAHRKEKVLKQELDLAVSLIDQMTKKFNPKEFKDEYREKIMSAIEEKIKGKEIVSPKDSTEPTKVINILDALQKSLKPERKKRVKDGA